MREIIAEGSYAAAILWEVLIKINKDKSKGKEEFSERELGALRGVLRVLYKAFWGHSLLNDQDLRLCLQSSAQNHPELHEQKIKKLQ